MLSTEKQLSIMIHNIIIHNIIMYKQWNIGIFQISSCEV